MGSRSTSSNTSQTDYNTVTTNLNLQGVDAGGGNVVAGSSGPVNILDGGAIKESFGFGANALDFGANALDFAETVNSRAMDEMGRTFSETLDAVNKSTEQIVGKVTIDSGERVEKSMRAMAWLAVAAIVGFSIIGRRASA